MGKRIRTFAAAAVAAASAAAPLPALGCPELRGRYEGREPYIGVFVGLSYGGKVRFAYGFDFRVNDLPTAFVRLEARGVDYVRLTVGALALGDDVGGELGLTLQSARQWSDVKPAFGVHVGAAAGNPAGLLMATGSIPVVGDRRNWDAAFTGVFVPGAASLGCTVEGRPLRVAGGTLLPAVVACRPFAPAPRDAALAEEWLEAARAEWASIPAFLRMGAELTAAGAPADLVRAASAAADDERRHAAICFRTAETLGGTNLLVAPLDATARWDRPTSGALACLAREAWLDGCLGEATAAEAGALAAGATRDDTARRTLRSIAADEERHAELAWAVLDWSCRAGGSAVRDEIASLADAARPTAAAAPAGVDLDSLRAAGAPGRLELPRASEVVADRATVRLRSLLS